MDFNQGHNKLASDLTLIGRSFGHVENVFYLATGVLLSITAALALFSASLALWSSVEAWGAPKEVIVTIDRVMFTLMLLELLHTVRVSIREHTLTPDPFLVVGLIASIRRVLVITLGSSQHPEIWTPEAQAEFNASLMELGVLGALIAILVVALFLIRQNRFKPLHEGS